MKKNKFSILKSSLALSCSLIPCFAMQDPNLNTQNPRHDHSLLATAHAKATTSPRQQSPFFTGAELLDIEIGRGIIHNRIANKQAVIDSLSDPHTPFEFKKIIMREDFGVVLHERGSLNEQSIESGYQFYCNYLTKIIEIYSFADQLTQLMLSAESVMDKNKYQNDLYYFLSYHIVEFKNFTANNYTHEIPEHSLEDTFYEMILSKIGKTATKEYDVITRYLTITNTPLGMKKQIDNGRLYSEYLAKHTEAMLPFKRDDLAHPVIWLGLMEDEEIKASATAQLDKASSVLRKCREDIIKITNTLGRELNGRSYEPATAADEILHAYNYFGPRILETIDGLEDIIREINGVKEDSDRWLKNIRDTKKLFKKIPKEQQGVITGYFKYWDDKARAEEQAKARAKAAAKKAEEEAKKATNREKERLRKERKALKDAAIKAEEATKQADSFHPAPQAAITKLTALEAAAADLQLTETNAENNSETGVPTTPPVLSTAKMAEMATHLTPTSPGADLPATPRTNGEDPASTASIHKDPTAPKIKIKTRKTDPSAAIVVPEDTRQDSPTPMLPEQFTTEAFTSLVQDLLNEKNDRKLIQLFKELKTTFGLDSDTNEKRNKGYFSIISPIDKTVKIATYHHYHTENPFGSIFMAVKDVLIAAHIIQR